jgi:hypothetical protein
MRRFDKVARVAYISNAGKETVDEYKGVLSFIFQTPEF